MQTCHKDWGHSFLLGLEKSWKSGHRRNPVANRETATPVTLDCCGTPFWQFVWHQATVSRESLLQPTNPRQSKLHMAIRNSLLSGRFRLKLLLKSHSGMGHSLPQQALSTAFSFYLLARFVPLGHWKRNQKVTAL